MSGMDISVRVGLLDIGMDWDENTFILEKLDLGALAGIMGGLLGLTSKDSMARIRAGQRYSR